MEAQEIVNAIGSVGFPIVASVGLFYLYDKTIKEIVGALTKVVATLDHVNSTLAKIDERLDNME